MEVKPLHYLESFDSVRSRVGDARKESDEQRAQALIASLEALVALALGADLVVPQSYVIDSVVCQRVIERVGQAHQSVLATNPAFWDERSLPVRLHLHSPATDVSADAFIDVARYLFPRIADGSWTSSAYPDLADHRFRAEILQAIARGDRTSPMDWLGQEDWRAERFAAVWDYLRTASRSDRRLVVEPARSSTAALEERMRAVIAALGHEDSSTTARARLRSALHKLFLEAAHPHPFAGRGLLHSSLPWADDGRSARAVVDDDEAWALVLEATNTQYNRVVADSTGASRTSFTTDLYAESSGAAPVLAAGEAQDAALDDGEAVSGRRLPAFFASASLNGVDESEVSPLIHAGAFAAVVRDREGSKWKNSLAALAAATASGGRTEIERAWDKHLRLLSRTLAGEGGFTVGAEKQGLLVAVRGAAGDVVMAGASAGLGFVNPWWSLATAGPPLAKRGAQAWGKQRQKARVYGTLGRLVSRVDAR